MYGMTNNRFGFIVAGIAAATMLSLPATAGAGGDATIISGGHKIEVRVDDGEISVIVDGKEISTDRILSRNGRIVILDEDGNEQALFGITCRPLRWTSFRPIYRRDARRNWSSGRSPRRS